jgi:hypothetical protein
VFSKKECRGAKNGSSFCLGNMIDRGCFNYRWPVTAYYIDLHPNREAIEIAKKKKREAARGNKAPKSRREIARLRTRWNLAPKRMREMTRCICRTPLQGTVTTKRRINIRRKIYPPENMLGLARSFLALKVTCSTNSCALRSCAFPMVTTSACLSCWQPSCPYNGWPRL